MILLDTSLLIDGATGPKASGPAIRAAFDAGYQILLPTLVLYEWYRGPRTARELDWQEALFPARSALAFGPDEAKVSAQLYGKVRRARTREVDIAIAACAIAHEAVLWTLNLADFRDIPGLQLYTPSNPLS